MGRICLLGRLELSNEIFYGYVAKWTFFHGVMINTNIMYVFERSKTRLCNCTRISVFKEKQD